MKYPNESELVVEGSEEEDAHFLKENASQHDSPPPFRQPDNLKNKSEPQNKENKFERNIAQIDQKLQSMVEIMNSFASAYKAVNQRQPKYFRNNFDRASSEQNLIRAPFGGGRLDAGPRSYSK